MYNPTPAIVIGPALISDIDIIDRIEQAAFNTPWSRDLLRAAVLNKQYRMRVLRSVNIGLAGFYIAHRAQERSNLDNLAVEETVRGRTFGSLLLQDWIDGSREEGLYHMTLQVNTANRRAQQLYGRFGFHTTRLLVSYYPNGEDAYQMERESLAAPKGRKAQPAASAARPRLSLVHPAPPEGSSAE